MGRKVKVKTVRVSAVLAKRRMERRTRELRRWYEEQQARKELAPPQPSPPAPDLSDRSPDPQHPS